LELQQSTEKIWLLQQDLEELWYDICIIQEELDSLVKEMKALRQRVEFIDLYHHQMEEFNNLKMVYLHEGRIIDLSK
jgi:hypothetical protein